MGQFSLGHVLYESGVALEHVYFPTSAIVALLYVMENGASAEIAVVGHDGIVPECADLLLDKKGYEGKSQGPRMDTYERFIAFVGWPDTGALMRRLDDDTSKHAGGKPGNINAHLGATEVERAANLKVSKAWVVTARGIATARAKEEMSLRTHTSTSTGSSSSTDCEVAQAPLG